MFSGVFGLAWTEWGASGISGAESTAIRVVGIVLGLIILFWCARLRRSAGENGSGSMFSSPSYRRIAIAEVVALVGGAAHPRSDRTPRIRHRLVRHRGRNTFSGVRATLLLQGSIGSGRP